LKKHGKKISGEENLTFPGAAVFSKTQDFRVMNLKIQSVISRNRNPGENKRHLETESSAV
jgi:hypothetical protein